jgi:hypothetical protein
MVYLAATILFAVTEAVGYLQLHVGDTLYHARCPMREGLKTPSNRWADPRSELLKNPANNVPEAGDGELGMKMSFIHLDDICHPCYIPYSALIGRR